MSRWFRLLGWVSCACALAGCGEAAESDPVEQEPEPQPTGCEAGSLELDDASCRPAGLGSEDCAPGFAHDGAQGCTAVLPAEACAPGLMAIPGDEACREVAPCGAEPWGEIPVAADTQHVAGSYGGADSDGSAERPWSTIQDGVDAAAPGAVVAVAAGHYIENIRIGGAPVALWGRCPGLVQIEGTSAGQATVFVGAGADGTEVRGLALTGPRFGVASSGSQNVQVDQVWIHDTASRGLIVEHTYGDSSITLRRSLVEAASGVGVMAYGAAMTLEATVVRDTRLGSSSGRGVVARLGSTVSLDACVIERNRDHALMISGSSGTVLGTVLRDTASGPGLQFGGGLAVRRDDDSLEPSFVTVDQSTIERSRYYGVLVEGSTATVERTVVRDTAPQEMDQSAGVGIQAQPHLEPATLTVRSSLLERNTYGGISLMGSSGHLESVVVRDTAPEPIGLAYGRGLLVYFDRDLAQSASATVLGSVFERNTEVGIFAAAVDLVVDACVVRDTLPRPMDGRIGRGISIQSQDELIWPSTAAISRSLIERNHEAGVFIEGSIATIDHTTVRETFPQQLGDIYGDNVLVTSMAWSAGAVEAQLTISASSIEAGPRVGIANFGGRVAMSDSALQCNSIDLNGQDTDVNPYAFVDEGGNACGCGEGAADCQVMTNQLEPPAPLDAP